ncbi:hypothetical protein [Clostridium sp.]
MKDQELKKYIKYKVKVLYQLGFKVEGKTFTNARNEIQVDNIAKNILLN